jgi:hypothetical protein
MEAGMSTSDGTEEARRARRLACWYPKAWRDRYGDEFEAMLAEQLKTQPHSSRRTFDIVTAGLRARVQYAGLIGDALPPRDAVSAALAWLAFGMVGFAVSTFALLRPTTITFLGLRGSALQAEIDKVQALRFVRLGLPANYILTFAGLLGLLLILTAALPIIWVAVTRGGAWARLALGMMAIGLAINVTSPGDPIRNGVIRGHFQSFAPVFPGALTQGWWARLGEGGLYAWIPFLVGSVLVVLNAPLSNGLFRFEARLARLMILSLIPIVGVCMWKYAPFAFGTLPLVGMVFCLVIALISIRRVNRSWLRLASAT